MLIKNFNFTLKKQVKMLVFISWLVSSGVCIQMQQLLELIKRRWKVQKKKISCKRGLNFDLWKLFSENYKPMRVWLWLVYKFTENYCRLRIFSEFIQNQKKYPTSLDKMHILTWKLLVIASWNTSCELNS